jgi:hypothetical protein
MLRLMYVPVGGYSTACLRFKVFMAVKIQVKVFWVMKLCSVVVGYQHLREGSCLHFQGEVQDSKVLWNIGILLQNYIASQPRRLKFEYKVY